MSDDFDDDQNGFGKPPKKHQFKPGQSGNPKGRPKGSKNVNHILTKILSEKITITEAGKKIVVDKLEAALRILVNTAFEGKPQSLKLMLETHEKLTVANLDSVENPFTDEDFEALKTETSWMKTLMEAQAKAEDDDPE